MGHKVLHPKLPTNVDLNSPFGKINLVIFALIFAGVGGYLLFTSKAANPSPIPINDSHYTTPQNGLLGTNPNFFPITVWLQTPQSNAQNYANISINTFSGLYDNPTSAALSALQSAGLGVMLDQQSIALNSFPSYGSLYYGWEQQDEPDNAQPDGSGGYGPCVSSSAIIQQYNAFKAADPTRPVLINFGEAVGHPSTVNRGNTCTGQNQGTGQYTYTSYAKGADILSFDVYPVNNGYSITSVSDGVDNLKTWVGISRPIWAFIETTQIDSGKSKPTPSQVKAEVWLALTHGATGIQYFAHIFTPTFIEAGLLSDSTMSSAVHNINTEITNLASVLNSPTISNAVTVSSTSRIDTMVKHFGGNTYIFAVSPASGTANVTFSPAGLSNGTVTVLDENRTLTMTNGSFTDSFTNYGVHLYEIPGSSSTPVIGDLNGDGVVNIFDLSIFLNHWQQTGTNIPEDFNNDGTVNIFDLSILLSHYGS